MCSQPFCPHSLTSLVFHTSFLRERFSTELRQGRSIAFLPFYPLTFFPLPLQQLRPDQWLKCVFFQPFSSQFRQISHQQKTEELLVTFALPGNADPEALPRLISKLTGERTVVGA